VFDTTSSNTGLLSGACVILEQLIGRPLLHLGWCHHVLALVLACCFWSAQWDQARQQEIPLFKRLHGQWASIDLDDYLLIMVIACGDYVFITASR